MSVVSAIIGTAERVSLPGVAEPVPVASLLP